MSTVTRYLCSSCVRRCVSAGCKLIEGTPTRVEVYCQRCDNHASVMFLLLLPDTMLDKLAGGYRTLIYCTGETQRIKAKGDNS